jgi:hypothetical protein
MKARIRIFLPPVILLLSCFVIVVRSQELVTAQELYYYSPENEVAFDSRFTNKTMRVSGTVMGNVFKNTRLPWNTGYSLWLGWIGQSYESLFANFVAGQNMFGVVEQGVRLFIKEANAEPFGNVRQGDEIVIQGRCIGRGGSYLLEYSSNRPNDVYIDNCTLIHRKSGAEIAKEKRIMEEADRKMRKEAAQKEKAAKEAERKAADEALEEEERKWEAKRAARIAAERAAEAERQAEQRRREGLVRGSYELSGGVSVVGKLVRPKYSGDMEEGQVVIKIVVSTVGEVQKATIDTKNTTVKDRSIRESALLAARQSKFTRSSKRSAGMIIYTFSH